MKPSGPNSIRSTPTAPGWGSIGLLPWDEAAMGMRSAELREVDARAVVADRDRFRAALTAWAREAGAELVACRVPTDAVCRCAALAAAGFTAVETSLDAAQPALRKASLLSCVVDVRRAQPDDHPEILAIARTAFRHGRYHADPRVPRERANKRYVYWVRRALEQPTPLTRVYVIGDVGQPSGFFHVEADRDAADLRLGAAHPQRGQGLAGFALYVGVLRALTREGILRARARISAGNTPVLNLYASMGFRFGSPEVVYHWHSPEARHLLPLEEAVGRAEEMDGAG